MARFEFLTPGHFAFVINTSSQPHLPPISIRVSPESCLYRISERLLLPPGLNHSSLGRQDCPSLQRAKVRTSPAPTGLGVNTEASPKSASHLWNLRFYIEGRLLDKSDGDVRFDGNRRFY
jgi:hypothetical protein